MGTRAVEDLLPLLDRAAHVDNEDEELQLRIAELGRELVKDIPFSYPVEAISTTSRQELLTIANRVEAHELEIATRQRRIAWKAFDEQSTELASEYASRLERIEADRYAWSDRLDRWQAELNPKAAKLVGEHTALLRTRQAQAARSSTLWLVLTGMLFLGSIATGVALVFEVSVPFASDLAMRQDQSDSFLSPLRGIALLTLTTGAMAWSGRQYQNRSDETRQLRDVADRLALTGDPRDQR